MKIISLNYKCLWKFKMLQKHVYRKYHKEQKFKSSTFVIRSALMPLCRNPDSFIRIKSGSCFPDQIAIFLS